MKDARFIIKPLTFLLGPNGSGKSTFLKALLFLQKNNFPTYYSRKDFYYDISNDIKLGEYKDIVTNGEIDRNIEYEFLINLKKFFLLSQNDYIISVKFVVTFSNGKFGFIETKYEDNESGLFSYDNWKIKGIEETLFLNYFFR